MKIDGIPVVDAKKSVSLNITKRDVRLSHTKHPGACAAATCCMRQMGVMAARIHAGRSYLLIGDKWLRFKTTPRLRQEIVAFDRGGTFEPGEYQLQPVPLAEIKLRGKRQGSDAKGARDKGSTNRKPKKSRRKYHHVSAIRSRIGGSAGVQYERRV